MALSAGMNPFRSTLAIFGFGVVLSSEAAELIQSVPLNVTPATDSISLFERLPAQQTGIDLVHEFPKNVPMEFLQDQNSGGGVCVGDYDGDGKPDVFFTHYNRGTRLYRNLGDWRFDDVTAQAGLTNKGKWC